MSEHTSSVHVPVWKTEINERIDACARDLGLPVDDVRSQLSSKLGIDGSDEQQLDWLGDETTFLFGDFRSVFEDIPIIRLRAAYKTLRTGKETAVPETTQKNENTADVVLAIKELIESNRPKSLWTTDQLLQLLSDEHDPDCAEELRKRSRGNRCIVFNPDGTINIQISKSLIKSSRKQTIPAIYFQDGRIYKPLRPGHFPKTYLDESPFAPGTPLINDYCEQTDTQWSGISHECRVLAHLHVLRIEKAKLSMRDMKAIVGDAKKGVASFREQYVRAAALYDELQESESLPKLRIASGEGGNQIDTGFAQNA